MMVRILLAALLAGLLGGVFATAAQSVKVIPLIVAAEGYESGESEIGHSHGNEETGGQIQAHSHGKDDPTWIPADGSERLFYTLLSNLVVGVAFSLLLTAVILFFNQKVAWKSGLLWGLAGFLTFVLAPNLGLPPELPGTQAAALGARQAWWLATVLCTGLGLALFAFFRHIGLMVLGVALIAAPHLYGAPAPAHHNMMAPAYLAVEFVVASVATAFVYWLFLGGVLGWLLDKAMQHDGAKEQSA